MIAQVLQVKDTDVVKLTILADSKVIKVSPSCGCSNSAITDKVIELNIKLDRVKDTVNKMAYEKGKINYIKQVYFKIATEKEIITLYYTLNVTEDGTD